MQPFGAFINSEKGTGEEDGRMDIHGEASGRNCATFSYERAKKRANSMWYPVSNEIT
jgi:hypothetical protein